MKVDFDVDNYSLNPNRRFSTLFIFRDLKGVYQVLVPPVCVSARLLSNVGVKNDMIMTR